MYISGLTFSASLTGRVEIFASTEQHPKKFIHIYSAGQAYTVDDQILDVNRYDKLEAQHG